MTPERLLANFDRISEAPDAIPRLRRFILDLAVRGKLVGQDPNDEPASALLTRIQAEKARLVKEGELKKLEPFPMLEENEIPFRLPKSWTWIRVADGFAYDAGAKREPEELNPDRWLLELEDIEKDTSRVLTRLKVCERESRSTKSEFKVNDILYGKLRPYLNKVVVADEPGYSTTEIVAIRPFLPLCSVYCSLAFRRPDFVEYVNRVGRGTKMPRLRTPDALVALFPLPPLAEQHRIVDKVDELMALCDRLEAAQAERESRRDRLATASLHRLNNGADAESFREHTRFHLHHLPRLATRPEHIQQLRQTILNLAVRGKLVPQDPNDEPASELLKRIGVEVSDEQPFQIPDSWIWVSVGQIGDSRLGKMLDKAKNKGTPRRYLRNVNVRWFDFDLSDVFEMRFEDAELEEFALRNGDVLICEGGEPGRAAVWDKREKDIFFQKAIHRVRFSEGVVPHFFVNAIRESADSGRLAGYFTGVGIKHFTGKGLSSFVFPLPCLAEQHRIVAKVEELMALCDRLEAQLTASQTESRRLLEAVLHEALNGDN